jgi:hypothetical protein
VTYEPLSTTIASLVTAKPKRNHFGRLEEFQRRRDQAIAAVQSWKTEDETSFVERLGLHGSRAGHRTLRRDLLRLYLDSIARRTDWGEIDRDIVRGHALWLLGRTGE